MSRFAAALAVLLCALAASSPAWATTYYVSPAGNDAATGTSPGAAWRSVGHVNDASLAEGDLVLFEGGRTFTDRTLIPGRSSLRFSSYGQGSATISNPNGAVWFSGRRDLVFDHLRLTTGGAAANVFAGAPEAGSRNIVLRNSVVSNTAGAGIVAPGRSDVRWTIERSTVSHTGDSGLIMLGRNHRVRSNRISDTGWNASIGYGRHGIYAKSAGITIANNDLSRDQGGQEISLRFAGARVFGNTIHDARGAIAFFDQDRAAAPQGRNLVYGNRGWNLASYAFYYDGQADANGAAPSVDFVLASNTFAFAGADEAVNVAPSGSARVTLVNNVFTGSYGSALRRAATTVEHHNLWSGGSSNVPAGTGDLRNAPALRAAPTFAPSTGSVVVDAGSVAVPGLSYTRSCNGGLLSFCGSAPDLGAIESNAQSRSTASAKHTRRR